MTRLRAVRARSILQRHGKRSPGADHRNPRASAGKRGNRPFPRGALYRAILHPQEVLPQEGRQGPTGVYGYPRRKTLSVHAATQGE